MKSLSPREKWIVVVTAVVLGLFLLDHFIVRPFYQSLDDLTQKRALLQGKLDDAKQTLAASHVARSRWAQFRAGGLQSDASATENNFLNAIRSWSQEARLPLASIRPDRSQSNHGLEEMSFQAGANGTMSAISAFLYRVETTHLPIRIREIQIASRTEGKDDLSLQLRLSTIWEDPSQAKKTLAQLPKEQR